MPQTKKRKHILIATSIIGVLVFGVAGYLLMRPPSPPTVSQARLELDPVLGNPNAPVTIVEYGAYGCHSCQILHERGTIEHILAEYDGQVNFIFRDFPFIIPTYDHMAAEVAQCVLDQGQDAFWQFHNLLYTDFFANSTRDELVSIAVENTGVDEAPLSDCVNALTHYETVQYDAQRGLDLGIQGTPSLFIDGQVIFSPTEENLRAAVEAALNS